MKYVTIISKKRRIRFKEEALFPDQGRIEYKFV